MDAELAATLAEMAAEDQRVRRLPEGEPLTFVSRQDPEAAKEWERVDGDNARRLGAILSRHGWPGRSLVGEQGSHDAWLIAQHADHHRDVQRQALGLLAEAVARGEASPRDLAYLTDRVRMRDGREQVFGTQIRNVEAGVATPWPIEHPEHVDQRRAEMGLEPLSDYTQWFAEGFDED